MEYYQGMLIITTPECSIDHIRAMWSVGCGAEVLEETIGIVSGEESLASRELKLSHDYQVLTGSITSFFFCPVVVIQAYSIHC